MITSYEYYFLVEDISNLVYGCINEDYSTGDIVEWNNISDVDSPKYKLAKRKIFNKVKRFLIKQRLKTKEDINNFINNTIEGLSNKIKNRKVRLSIIYIVLLAVISVSASIFTSSDINISNENKVKNPNIKTVINKVKKEKPSNTIALQDIDTLIKRKIDKNIPSNNKKVLDNILPNANGKNYEQFLYDLAKRESDGNWRESTGYHIGLWQMGYPARKDAGYGNITTKKFKRDQSVFPPSKQLDAIKNYIKIISDRYMKEYIDKYSGTVINGIPITKSGIIAASHLVGPKHVKRYLDSGGKKIKSDANKTSLEEYLKIFYNYKI